MSQTYNSVNDADPIETQEWLDALSSVLKNEGPERAHFILENLVKYTAAACTCRLTQQPLI